MDSDDAHHYVTLSVCFRVFEQWNTFKEGDEPSDNTPVVVDFITEERYKRSKATQFQDIKPQIEYHCKARWGCANDIYIEEGTFPDVVDDTHPLVPRKVHVVLKKDAGKETDFMLVAFVGFKIAEVVSPKHVDIPEDRALDESSLMSYEDNTTEILKIPFVDMETLQRIKQWGDDRQKNTSLTLVRWKMPGPSEIRRSSVTISNPFKWVPGVVPRLPLLKKTISKCKRTKLVVHAKRTTDVLFLLRVIRRMYSKANVENVTIVAKVIEPSPFTEHKSA